MKKKKIIGIAIIAVGVILSVVGWFVLPDSVGVNLTMQGFLANELPKPAAIILSLAVTCLGSILIMRGEDEDKLNWTGLAVGLIGIVSFFASFAFNGVF